MLDVCLHFSVVFSSILPFLQLRSALEVVSTLTIYHSQYETRNPQMLKKKKEKIKMNRPLLPIAHPSLQKKQVKKTALKLSLWLFSPCVLLPHRKGIIYSFSVHEKVFPCPHEPTVAQETTCTISQSAEGSPKLGHRAAGAVQVTPALNTG